MITGQRYTCPICNRRRQYNPQTKTCSICGDTNVLQSKLGEFQ